MTRSDHIPAPAVKRLSLYLRQLEQFQTNDHKTISSRQLGDALSLSDAQVRKDLAYFGQFGYPGVGYRVPELIVRVRRILGTDRESPVVLVGLGNLGRALLSFRGFSKKGFEVVAVFDRDPAKIGRELDGRVGLKTQPLDEMPAVVRARSIRLGILAVPANAAQEVAELMVSAGIRGILNFAPVRLRLGPEVVVSSVDLAVYIEQLSFRLGAATT